MNHQATDGFFFQHKSAIIKYMIRFGTGGFRGVIGQSFTKENVKKITQALANVYHQENAKKPICVGYDFRSLSLESSVWISEVLLGNAIPVLLSKEPTPTPTIMEESKRFGNEFGVMITASHNPFNFNGVKIFEKDGMDAEKPLTDRLEKEISSLSGIKECSLEEGKRKGLLKENYPLEDYLNNILSFVHIEKKAPQTKILLDPIYGTGSLTLKKILTSMGFTNVNEIHGGRDVKFGGLLPNPTKDNMEKDRAFFLKGKYDIAIGTDSDCDRIAVLDEKGEYVDANEILGALYYYLIAYRGMKGDIVKNIASSDLLDALAHKLGYVCHQVDVGFKNISAAMKEYDALLGGEGSGGLTMRGYIFGKDSTFATALFLEMVANLGKPVSKIIEESNKFAHFDKIVVEDSLSFENKETILQKIREGHFPFEREIRSVEHLNSNWKYRLQDGDWFLLRFSGTEPLVRLFLETNKENEEKGVNFLKQIKDFLS